MVHNTQGAADCSPCIWTAVVCSHRDADSPRATLTETQSLSCPVPQGDIQGGKDLGVAMRREWRAHDADVNMVSTLHKHAALPSLARHTPPQYLAPEVVMGMRDAACKLFKVNLVINM